MTKTKTSNEKKSDDKNVPAAKNEKRSNPRHREAIDRKEKTAEQPAETPAAARPTVTMNDSNLLASYANLCRVSSTPEELILDLGLNPNPYSQTDTTVQLSQRVIMNHFTAKRLLAALSVTLQRHEQAFGVLEVDVNKRVKTQ